MLGMVVAMTPQKIIGTEAGLPWHLPSDLERFQKITRGHAVIQGMSTFASIIKRNKRPLPERLNIVLTRSSPEMVRILGGIPASSPEQALAIAKQRNKRPFVIGGAQVYERMFPLVRDLHVTIVQAESEEIPGKEVVILPLQVSPPGRHWRVEDFLTIKKHHPEDQFPSSYTEYILD